MIQGRTGLAVLWLRIGITFAIGGSLLLYGGLEQHGALAFIGGLALGYACYGLRIAITPLRGIRVSRTLLRSDDMPYAAELRWHTELMLDKGSRALIQLEDQWRVAGREEGVVVSVRLCCPARGQTASFTQSIEEPSRGRYTLESWKVTVSDLWGWFKKSHVQWAAGADSLQSFVLPSRSQWGRPAAWNHDGAEFTSEGSPSERRSEAAGFLTSELRSYQWGDTHRRIDWRYYARRRELAVRTTCKDERPAFILFVDDRLPLEEDAIEPLERLLAAAAYECFRAYRAGAAVKLLFAGSTVISQGNKAIAERIVCFSKAHEQSLQARLRDAGIHAANPMNRQTMASVQQLKGSEVHVLSYKAIEQSAQDLPDWLSEARIKEWRALPYPAPSKMAAHADGNRKDKNENRSRGQEPQGGGVHAASFDIKA